MMNFLSLGQHERLGLGKISHRKRFVKKSKKSQFYLFVALQRLVYSNKYRQAFATTRVRHTTSELNLAKSLGEIFVYGHEKGESYLELL